MNLALFRCCVTSLRLRHYEDSTNAVLDALGVGFEDVADFGCCGYPLKNFDFKAYVLSSARNLALAERESLDMMTSCNCCYGSLKQARAILEEDADLRREVNGALAKEGLRYDGDAKVLSVLEVFHDLLGTEAIKERLQGTYKGLRVATHYGCHLLRPGNVVDFDHPRAPKKFDALVEATGARSVPWTQKLECCGSPVSGVNDELSASLGRAKMDSARQAGADLVCVICPYCQIQFDWVRGTAVPDSEEDKGVPSLYYHQLLGLCLGLDDEALGLAEERLRTTGVKRALRPVRRDSEEGATSAA